MPPPPPFNEKVHDVNIWKFASIVYEYFSFLSTELLVDSAAIIMSDFASDTYKHKVYNHKFIGMLLDVINDIWMHCDEQELDTISEFKQDLKDTNSIYSFCKLQTDEFEKRFRRDKFEIGNLVPLKKGGNNGLNGVVETTYYKGYNGVFQCNY